MTTIHRKIRRIWLVAVPLPRARGFLFRHSADEDIQQTQEVGIQLQTARQRRKARPGRRRSARAQAG